MKKIILMFATLLAFGSANAQVTSTSATQAVAVTIPEIALIAATQNGTPDLTFNATLLAGGIYAPITSSTTNLQYTSILGIVSLKKRAIYVSTSATPANLTTGVSLKVEAVSIPTANFTAGGVASTSSSNGVFGTIDVAGAYIKEAASALVKKQGFTYSTATPTVISNIESCYTGSVAGSGPLLKYTASVTDAMSAGEFGALRAGSYSFTVQYTLADML
jgi:hypothetical protein